MGERDWARTLLTFGRSTALYCTSSPFQFTFSRIRAMSNGSATHLRRRGSIDVVDAKVAVDLATAQTYSENVFLFVPNLIGTLFSILHIPKIEMASLTSRRVFQNHPCRRGAPLYELSPKVLYHCLRYLVFAGCRRWTRREGTQPDLKIWGSIGHGNRSVCSLL